MRAVKITGLILVLAFGVYSLMWYINGKANLRQVEKWMGDLSENSLVKSMEYESLSLKGYPFSIKVVMEKPKFSINTQPMMALLASASRKPINIPQNSEIKGTTDRFVLTTSVIGCHYTLTSDGDFLSTLTSGQTVLPFKATADNDGFTVRLNWLDALTKYRNLEALANYRNEDLDPQIAGPLEIMGLSSYSPWLTEVKMLKFFGKNVRLANATNDETLYTIDEYDYRIMHEDISAEKIMVGFDLMLKNMNATDAYSNMEKQLMKAFGIADHKPQPVQVYQNSDVTFKVKYEGPNSRTFKNPNGAVKLDIDIALNNDLYDYDNNGTVVANFKDGKFVNADFDLGGGAEFKPNSHKYMLEVYSDVLKEIDNEIKATSPSSLSANNPQMDRKVIAFMEQHLEEWVPKFEDLGRIQGTMKVFAEQIGSMAFNLDMKDLSLANKLYGVAFDGKLNASMLNPIPNGYMNLNLASYEVMLDRAEKYVDLLIKFYDENQMAKPMYLDEQLIPRMKKLFSALAEDGSAKDLLIKSEFNSKPPFVTVGGKDEGALMELIMQIFPPPPPPPPAAPTELMQNPIDNNGLQQSPPSHSEMMAPADSMDSQSDMMAVPAEQSPQPLSPSEE